MTSEKYECFLEIFFLHNLKSLQNIIFLKTLYFFHYKLFRIFTFFRMTLNTFNFILQRAECFSIFKIKKFRTSN